MLNDCCCCCRCSSLARSLSVSRSFLLVFPSSLICTCMHACSLTLSLLTTTVRLFRCHGRHTVFRRKQEEGMRGDEHHDNDDPAVTRSQSSTHTHTYTVSSCVSMRAVALDCFARALRRRFTRCAASPPPPCHSSSLLFSALLCTSFTTHLPSFPAPLRSAAPASEIPLAIVRTWPSFLHILSTGCWPSLVSSVCQDGDSHSGERAQSV